MINKRLILLSLTAFLISCGDNGDKSSIESKKPQKEIITQIKDKKSDNSYIDTIVALNDLHYSLYKITSYNNKIILYEEYNNIINNLNLRYIKDKEIVVLIKRIMNTLTGFQITEDEKEYLQKEYQNKLDTSIEDIVINMGKDIAKNMINPEKITENIKDIKKMVDMINPASIILNSGSLYSSYRDSIQKAQKNYDNSNFKIEVSTIKDLDSIRREFLDVYWKLLTKYNIPDNLRISEKQFENLLDIVKNSKDDKSLERRLLREEKSLSIVPMYWYELCMIAYKNGDKDKVFYAIDKYKKLNYKFLRNNSYYSLMLANKVTFYNYKTQKNEIKKILEDIVKIDRDNRERKMFLAMEYNLIGDTKKAILLLNQNIDDNFMVSINRKLKLEIDIAQKDIEAYKKNIANLIISNSISSKEYLEYFGKQPIKLLEEHIKTDIDKIDIEVEKSLYGKNNLVVKIDKKWFYRYMNNINIKVYINKKIFNPQITTDEDMIIATFKDTLDVEKVFDNNLKELKLEFIYNKNSIKVSYSIIKPDIKKSNSMIEELTNKSKALYDKYGANISFKAFRVEFNNKCFNIGDLLKECKIK